MKSIRPTCPVCQADDFELRILKDERARYQTMPLAELPVDTLRGYGGSALLQADWAARLDSLDWQALPRIQPSSRDVLPAELGPLQVLARSLRVRFRAEVAGRHFEDAARSSKTMFALARQLGEHPTELAGFVGLWVAHLNVVTLEELVQQPGCPNLYWALTDLPSPLVDLRKGVQGGRTVIAAEMQLIRNDSVMTESELEACVSRLSGLISFAREQAGHSPRNLRAKLAERAKDLDRVSVIRTRLIEGRMAEEIVKKLSPLQVILLDERLEFEVQQDDRIKLLALPLWQLDRKACDETRPGAGDGLFADLLPRIVELRQTQGGLDQEIAMLRQVEALRLHAAAHDGKLPAKLSEITVPLPSDPVTGKPFVYEVSGTTAQLRGSPIRDHGSEPGAHFEVIFTK